MTTKRVNIIFFISVLLVTIFAAQSYAALTIAPVNPAYLDYISAKRDAAYDSSTANKNRSAKASVTRRSGVIPTVFDASHIKTSGEHAGRSKGTNRDGDIPLKFSLLDSPSKVTGVKNQGSYGTCWAFATMASIESGFINTRVGIQDLSERHLAWFTYSTESPTKPAFTKSTLLSHEDPVYDQGGTNFMATAILSRWTGPVTEDKCPYSGIGKDTVGSDILPFGQLKSAYFLSNRDASNAIDNSDIKSVLQSGQAVYVSFSWAESNYDAGTCSYYNPTVTEAGGHAVTIVGWDDEYAASNFKDGSRPTADGAWLIRNSWGRDWGNDGTFWISYEDPNLKSFTQFVAATSDLYNKQYSYDPLGMINSGGITSSTVYAAAIFKTEGKIADGIPELIKAIGFYATNSDITYLVDVYTGVTAGNPRSGTKATSTSGVFNYAGYQTIVLPETVVVKKGDSFSVIVKVTGKSGFTEVIPLEVFEAGTSEAASANAGETFYSSDGTVWNDVYADDETASICIKAFSNEVIPAKTVNLLPINGKEGLSLNPLLKIRAFSATNGVAHAATQWKVGINDAFVNGLVVDSGDDSENLLEYSIPADKLDYDTTYYWKVRQKGSNGQYSDWSSVTSFKTAAKGVTPVSEGGGGCNTGLFPIILLMGLTLIIKRNNNR